MASIYLSILLRLCCAPAAPLLCLAFCRQRCPAAPWKGPAYATCCAPLDVVLFTSMSCPAAPLGSGACYACCAQLGLWFCRRCCMRRKACPGPAEPVPLGLALLRWLEVGRGLLRLLCIHLWKPGADAHASDHLQCILHHNYRACSPGSSLQCGGCHKAPAGPIHGVLKNSVHDKIDR